MKANFFLIFLTLFPLSCGKFSPHEKVEHVINKANFYLTTNQCDKALDTLDDITYQEKNIDYILANSSALACRGGYSTTKLFLTEFTDMKTGQDSLLASLATFSTSSKMTGEEDMRFVSIRRALNHLLLPGGIAQSSHINRMSIEDFSKTDVERLNVLAFYLTLIQLGKIVFYYGNTDKDGAKGKGTQGNDCYLTYSDTSAQALVALAKTGCGIGGDGHSELDSSRTMRCYGIILFNNFLDLLTSLAFIGKKKVKKLIDLSKNISDLCESSKGTYDFGQTCITKTLSRCIDDTVNHSDTHIERYYALIYESMHK